MQYEIREIDNRFLTLGGFFDKWVIIIGKRLFLLSPIVTVILGEPGFPSFILSDPIFIGTAIRTDDTPSFTEPGI